jgi:hypothetical protein
MLVIWNIPIFDNNWRSEAGYSEFRKHVRMTTIRPLKPIGSR